MDWGYTNPTAAVVFGVDGDDRAWQLDEWYERRAALSETVLPALCDLTRRCGVREWYCGPDEPEHIAALTVALASAHLPYRALPPTTLCAGIQTVTRQLTAQLTRQVTRRSDGTRGLYVAPRCIHNLAEYGTYAYPSGDLTPQPPSLARAGGAAEASEMPIKANDHAMDATRYALHTALARVGPPRRGWPPGCITGGRSERARHYL